MNPFSKPAEELSREAKEYLDLRLDDIKLRTAKGLSISLSKLVGMLVIVGVALGLLLILSFGLILLLGELTGSYAWSAIGVAVLQGVALWILIRKRDGLFKDTFVPVFIDLLFSDDDEDEK